MILLPIIVVLAGLYLILHAIGRASRPTSWRQWVYAVAVVLVPVAGFAVAGGVGGQLRVDPDSGPVQVSR
jgi:hypothetical protein